MPRLTIKLLMLLVGLSAVLIALSPFFFRSFQLLGFIADRLLGGWAYAAYAALIAPLPIAWLVCRRRPRLSAWAFASAAILMNASTSIVCIYLYSIGGIILMGAIWALLIPFASVSGAAWARTRSRLPKPAAWAIVLVLGLLPLSVPSTLWPLRLAALISRPWMDRLAGRIASGEGLAAPEWAGLYRVVDAKREPRNGNVALIIDANPAGRSAFVLAANPAEPYLPMVNLNFNEPLGGRWYYQNED